MVKLDLKAYFGFFEEAALPRLQSTPLELKLTPFTTKVGLKHTLGLLRSLVWTHLLSQIRLWHRVTSLRIETERHRRFAIWKQLYWIKKVCSMGWKTVVVERRPQNVRFTGSEIKKYTCIILIFFIVWFGYLCASQREAEAAGPDDVGFGRRPCDWAIPAPCWRSVPHAPRWG